MQEKVVIKTIEQFRQFLAMNNLDESAIEIVQRGKHKRINAFLKMSLDGTKEAEAASQVEQLTALLDKNNHLSTQSIRMLGNISTLSSLSVVFSGLNLFATAAGFAVMNKKLNKVSAQIDLAIRDNREMWEINTNKEIRKVILDHSRMLDCRKRQHSYNEEQMWGLVSDEYNALEQLMELFIKGKSIDPADRIYTMLSMASMFAASLQYFDETYYFNNLETITDEDAWFLDHDKLVSTFDKMLDMEFIEKIQDYGIFALDLNTSENDCFYKSCISQIRNLKESISDNQKLIMAIKDPELFKIVNDGVCNLAKSEIDAILSESGVNPATFENEKRIAVA